MNMKLYYEILKDTFNAWSEDKAFRLAAALSFYGTFSLVPFVILIVGVASLIFGADVAQKDVVDEIGGTVGAPVAKALQDILVKGQESGWGAGLTIIGIATLLFGAMGVFGQLQDALNTVWKVTPKPGRGIWGIIQDRFLSLTLVLGTGFLLLISLVLTAALAALNKSFSEILPGGAQLWQAINQLVAVAVVALLFAMIFRLLPDARIGWRDVWLGAILTAILFSLGKYLLGLYLGREGVASEFGAASSLVVILMWVYYASLILLFGAEFTRVYAQKMGSSTKPTSNAVALTTDARLRQGMPRQDEIEMAARRTGG
jgi:membrane protein